jgi:hypothetical protein
VAWFGELSFTDLTFLSSTVYSGAMASLTNQIDNEVACKNALTVWKVIPEAFRNIIYWGCDKDPNESYADHVTKKMKNLSNNQQQIFKKNSNDKLKKNDAETFDVTFLNTIMSLLLCDKIAPSGSKEWEQKKKDPNSVESLLKEAKDYRNNIEIGRAHV